MLRHVAVQVGENPLSAATIASMKRTLASVLVLFALTACSDEGGEGGSGEETETGGSIEGLDEHGTVRVQVSALDGDTSIFEGTERVLVTLNYLDCLQGFYTGSGAAWRQGGVAGGPVFEAFVGTLCEEPGAPACTINAITSLVDSDANDFEITVDYAIEDIATLEGAEFALGPLPNVDLAGCSPRVQMRSDGVSGVDAAGDQVWRLGTISGTNEAMTDDVLPIQITAVTQ